MLAISLGKSYADLRMETAGKEAEESNCDIIVSPSNVLQLDLDSEDQQTNLLECWNIFCDSCLPAMCNYLQQVRAWVSRGGVGIHVEIELGKDVETTTRIALQSGLGSDPKRELLSISRKAYGMDNPSLLFRPREAKVVVADSFHKNSIKRMMSCCNPTQEEA